MGEPMKCLKVGKELPDDLKEEILAWMPLKSLCRFRTVSEQWNALLLSTEFITRKWAEAPPNREPWLVMYDLDDTKSTCLAYSFYTQGWQKTSCISISFMPEKFAVFGREHRFLFRGYAAGLFLHEVFGIMSGGYNVCNPVTRTFIELPPILSISPRQAKATGIVGGDGDSRETYKVVVVGESAIRGEKRNIVEIYDSSEKSWSIAGHLLQDVYITDAKMIFCYGSFYCIVFRSGGLGITGFSLREGTEIFAFLPKMPDGKIISDRALLACGLRVLFAAGVVFKVFPHLLLPLLLPPQLHEVIIWEFEKLKLDDSSSSSVDSSSTSSQWKEIAKMPSSMLNDLNRKRVHNISSSRNLCPRPLKCVAVGDHVCFTLQTVIYSKVMDVVVYNLKENSWSWLPSCPLDYYSSFSTNVSITAFEPRINMKVG